MTDEPRESTRQDGSDAAGTQRATRASYPEELYGEAGTIQGRVGPCDAVNVPDSARQVAKALGLDAGASAGQRQEACETEQEREQIRARTKM